MAYVLFTPLYIGGPITSYNAFASHLRTPSRAMPLRTMAVYVVRIGFVYVVNVFLLHFVFVNCFSSSRVALQSLSNGDRAFLMLYALALLWLKFTFIWRTSRLFALWCGVEAPENMRRCFVNSLTVRDFWRDWHASFNLWIVRYMYIPMGGRRHQLLAVAPIFLFVALWHDHTLSMLKWAACIVTLFLLETIVSGVFQRASQAVSAALSELDAHDGECVRRGVAARVARCLHGRLSPRARRVLHRYVCLAGASVVLFLLPVANLIGFHQQQQGRSGPSQTDATLLGLLLSVSWQFWLNTALFILLSATGSLYRREEEARRLDVRMWQLGIGPQGRKDVSPDGGKAM